MSILLTASELSHSFSVRPLFDSISFTLQSHERVGLIGPNGAGKSTLLKILAGRIRADRGILSLQKGLRIAYLEQVPQFDEGSTVESALLGDDFDESDWETRARAEEIMSKLSLTDPLVKTAKLSGGWRKRVAIARELVREPDLFLLDEPTNHLDLDSIFWLEEFLANASFATLVITHDRFFLEKVSDRIIELDRRNPNGLLSINGNYSQYLETKEQLMAAQENREIRLKNTLRRETEWLRQGAKARTTKQQARIQRAGDLKTEVEELEFRNVQKDVQIKFQSSAKVSKKLLECKEITKSFAERKIFEDLSLIVTPGMRLGIMGHNGCGKSTLVRTLLGLEPADSGELARSENLAVAYFEQNREALDPNETVMKTLCPHGDHVTYRGNRTHIRSYLDRFLFTQGQMEMAIGKLSGGEQSRLLIAKLMLQDANLLVLDEPTNDLDLSTLRILEDCLVEFPGAIFLVTHDRYFMAQVATHILAFTPPDFPSPVLEQFSSFEQWQEWYSSILVQEKNKKSQPKGDAHSPASSKKKSKMSFKETRELESMETTIQKLEQALRELETSSQDSKVFKDAKKMAEVSQKMRETQLQIDTHYARWSELEQKEKG